MPEEVHDTYQRIAQAIEYIKTNFKAQPNLEEIAQIAHLSPFHFQRLFKDWAGTSPKKFLQYTSIEYAKKQLKESESTLFDTAFDTGLSSTSRLHDLFVKIEGMTPAEYKNGGKNLNINYSFSPTNFGEIIIASTQKGICYIAFLEDRKVAFELLKGQFPFASFIQENSAIHMQISNLFSDDWSDLNKIKLHLKGTDFQLKVWETLLKIPSGKFCTYGLIAKKIDKPKASRAVGSAIGKNPIAFLIPCHRVIQSSGSFGGYMWGNTRKTAILGWEATTINEK